MLFDTQVQDQWQPETRSQLQQLQMQLRGVMAAATHADDLQNEMDDMQAGGPDAANPDSFAARLRAIRRRVRQLNAEMRIQSRDRDKRFHGPCPREYDQTAHDDEDTISVADCCCVIFENPEYTPSQDSTAPRGKRRRPAPPANRQGPGRGRVTSRGRGRAGRADQGGRGPARRGRGRHNGPGRDNGGSKSTVRAPPPASAVHEHGSSVMSAEPSGQHEGMARGMGWPEPQPQKTPATDTQPALGPARGRSGGSRTDRAAGRGQPAPHGRQGPPSEQAYSEPELGLSDASSPGSLDERADDITSRDHQLQQPRRGQKRPRSSGLVDPTLPKYKLYFGAVERCRYLRTSGSKREYMLAARLPKQHATGELMLRWFEELPDPATHQQQLIPWAPLVQHDMQLPGHQQPQQLPEHHLKAFVQPLSNPREQLSQHIKVCDGSFVDVVTFHHVPSQKCYVLDYEDDQHCFGFLKACNEQGKIVDLSPEQQQHQFGRCSKKPVPAGPAHGRPITVVGSRKARRRARQQNT